jgi:hypothetical protein
MDYTQRIRLRRLSTRDKVVLAVCFLVAVLAVAGWLLTRGA